ncbi:MAG TPA: hypothetical protein DCS60_06005 [Opitutae bacterium]|nr:hypothetical protein [Opitutae bacterium]|tara:strand:+ start:363 stop:869 length:507 start_codon:yes stop_codon:yes gene_type:complete
MSRKAAMSRRASADVVSALLAELVSQPANTSRKTSPPSRRKRKCSGTSTKPTKAAVLSPGSGLNRRQEESANADLRLKEFILGLRPGVVDEQELWHDRENPRTYTLEEIGQIMGVSRERVRQIEEASLRKLWRLLDIMSQREGLKKDDWINMLNDRGGGDEEFRFAGA